MRKQKSPPGDGGLFCLRGVAMSVLVALDMTIERIELGRQAGEIRGNVFDVLLGQGGDEALHDGIGALAGFVLVQSLLQVHVVLAGKARVLRVDSVAVGAVAREAGGSLLFAGVDIAGSQ